MSSGSVLWNVLCGGECSLVLSCPVQHSERRRMFSGTVLWNVL